VVFERTEHEPEEYDPEAELRDPDTDSVTIPQVETDESDVSAEIATAFWTTTLVVNVAVFFVALGLMLLVFWGDLRRGGGLLLGGIVLFGLAVRRYRAFRAKTDAESDSERPDRTDQTSKTDSPTPDRSASDDSGGTQ